MTLSGKGWFIWQVSRCEGGSPAAIADRAVSAGLSHVLLKVAERTYAYGVDRQGRDLVLAAASELHARGLQVWGWHYVYGDKPVAEAEIAVRRCAELGLDGYVIDAEREYKLPGRAAAAQRFMATLRGSLPGGVPVALSSYRYPSLHRQVPWAEFLEGCDLAMPQVYWEQAHNPAPQLARAVREYQDTDLVRHQRPIVPTGAAYGTGGWRATPDDVEKFLREAQRLSLPAANFYSWDYAAASNNGDLWDVVASFDWRPGEVTPDVEGPVRRYFEALNQGTLQRVLDCYDPQAAHVTAQRTRVGHLALHEWYRDFLQDLAGAEFTLHALSGTGNTRHAEWTALAPQAQVLDGADTFGVLNGRIVYHTTDYRLIRTPDIVLATL